MREQGDEGEETPMTMIGVLQKEEEGDIDDDEEQHRDIKKKEEEMREKQ